MDIARCAAALIVVGLLPGCRAVSEVVAPRKAIPELPYSGDRPDAPPLGERGNAVFTAASYDDEGKLLVTLPFFGSANMQVWDAATGALVSSLDAGIPNFQSHNLWMIDSRRQRLLGARHPDTGYYLFDLKTGAQVARLEDDNPKQPAFAVGLVGDGNEVMLFKPGWIEIWQLDPPQLARRAASPLTAERYFPTCTGGIPATYNDKRCWEWSWDHRTLAVAFTPEAQAATQFMLIDANTLQVTPLVRPEESIGRGYASFAFSPNDRWLALGTNEELLLYDRTTESWRPRIPGKHQRNNVLGPMRFTPDGRHLIALGDQLQVSAFEVATGALAGRHEPDFENWEGELKVSLDGSRMLVYKFVSDTFEVLDGSNARRLGWVCPYFCNVKHNPNQPPYAVSPDGRSVAISHRRGAAVWDTATDQIRFPLRDPKRKPLPHPYER